MERELASMEARGGSFAKALIKLVSISAFCMLAMMVMHGTAFAAEGVTASTSNLKAQSLAIQTADDESEPNDTFDAAQEIDMGTTYYGTASGAVYSGIIGWTEYYSTKAERYDIYSVTLASSGAVKLTFTNDRLDTSGIRFYVVAHNKYYETFGAVADIPCDSTRPTIQTYSLPKGTTYFRVFRAHGYYSDGEPNHPYHFNLSYVVGGTTIKKMTPAKKAFTVKWTKKSGAAKYQIRYATNKSMDNAKIVNVSKKSASKKLTKLKRKKTYYAQVRVIKKIDGKLYYSSWSPKKKVKTK